MSERDNPVTGIMVGLTLAVVFWALVAVAVWWM